MATTPRSEALRRRFAASERLSNAQAALKNRPFSAEAEIELESAEKGLRTARGQTVEGVGGLFGEATPPESFSGSIGAAPEGPEAAERSLADVQGSRAIRGTEIVRTGAHQRDRLVAPTKVAQAGFEETRRLQQEIANKKAAQQAFDAQRGPSAPSPEVEAVEVEATEPVAAPTPTETLPEQVTRKTKAAVQGAVDRSTARPQSPEAAAGYFALPTSALPTSGE